MPARELNGPNTPGRTDVAEQLARIMKALAGDSALLPEQVWDSAAIPARELFIGHASGSAMSLVWAHAEYVKLCPTLAVHAGVHWSLSHSGSRAFFRTICGAPVNVLQIQRSRLARSTV